MHITIVFLRAWIASLVFLAVLISTDVFAQPIERASDDEVDRLMSLATGVNFAQMREEFDRLGASATPRLAEHVLGGDRNKRLVAIVCLQFCWSDVARDALVKVIPDADTQSRELAFQVLGRHESGERLAETLSPLIESRDHRIAGPAIQYTLRTVPDKDLLKQAMEDRRLIPYVSEVLPRYYGSDLSDATRGLARKAKIKDRANLIIALIHQQDERAETRKLVASNLSRGPAMLHDRAAEYLRYHGTTEDLAVLQAALDREREVYAKASIQAAIDAINKRAKRFDKPGEAQQADYPDDPAQAYRQAYETLGLAYTQANRAAAIKLLADAEPYEPYLRFGLTQPTDASRSRITERLILQVLTSGYTIQGVSLIGDRAVAAQDDAPMPEDLVTASLIPPVRDYFDSKRKSFGIHTGNTAGPFSNRHHMGDDVAWGLEHESIVAIGDGIVRRVVIGQSSWGGLVIVEHRDAEAVMFCSLYSHLGPLIAVREGDSIKQGQKIGSLGRTHTWEGGGYRAHLHFGIHEGPYTQEQRWITGYITHDHFQGDHGWVDPQPYIRKRLAR